MREKIADLKEEERFNSYSDTKEEFDSCSSSGTGLFPRVVLREDILPSSAGGRGTWVQAGGEALRRHVLTATVVRGVTGTLTAALAAAAASTPACVVLGAFPMLSRVYCI